LKRAREDGRADLGSRDNKIILVGTRSPLRWAA